MRNFLSILWYSVVGVCFWLADAMFLSFFNEGTTFVSALWTEAAFYRIALRCVVVVLLLALGFRKCYERQNASRIYPLLQNMDAEEDLLWGSAESGNKSQRLLYHTLRLAAYFNMPNNDRENLRTLCYCYNLGKVSIPFDVLESNAKRSEYYQEVYDKHAEYGAELASQFDELRDAAPLIKYHHEYFNGGGIYGLKGAEIPLSCRIFQVVFAFDCMIYPTFRSKAFVCDEALLELRYYSGTAFDPEVIEAFIKLMTKRTIFSGVGKREFSLR